MNVRADLDFNRDNVVSIFQVVDDAADQATPRRAKWWYVTFHNVTAMVGAGVLSLPYAMAHLGW
jgi:hypothetical protein